MRPHLTISGTLGEMHDITQSTVWSQIPTARYAQLTYKGPEKRRAGRVSNVQRTELCLTSPASKDICHIQDHFVSSGVQISTPVLLRNPNLPINGGCRLT